MGGEDGVFDPVRGGGGEEGGDEVREIGWGEGPDVRERESSRGDESERRTRLDHGD